MKTIRSLMTLAGLILAIFALSATGAKAQAISTPTFSGNFTLPVAAQWGAMTLPAGEYTLTYGAAFGGGNYAVMVSGKTDRSIRGIAIVSAKDEASTKNDALVCIRQGDALIVRTLEITELHTAALFLMPHGARLVARNAKHNGYTQLAEAPMLIERVPVTFNSK